jgi:hypothetical protein
MTVIAWDGHTLATDKQATNSGLRFTVTKSVKLESGEVLAWTGNMDTGQMIANWYKDGADAAKWPECQKDKDDWSRLIVVKDGKVFVYEQRPVAMEFQDKFMAWGSGRDYAIGAMAKGASAIEAVHIAMRFDNGCGCGVDSYPIADRGEGK